MTKATTKPTPKAAAKPAVAKPAAKKPAAKGADPDLLDGIYVRSLPATFRRAGFTFTREGHGLLLANLSQAQLDAIEGEPMLSVTPAQFPATTDVDAWLGKLAKEQAEADNADDSDIGDAKEGANASADETQTPPESQEGNA